MNLKHLLAAAGVGAALVAAIPAAASAEPPKLKTNFYLDAHDSADDRYAGPVTGPVLAEGVRYIATVSGTISYYSRATWSNPRAPFEAICGNQDPRPVFRSPDITNGPTGMDAETVFARPCSGPEGYETPTLGHWNNFEVNNNAFYRHPGTIHGHEHTWTSDNTYEYPLLGHGPSVKFRLRDLPGTGDNYGRLRINVRKAVPADCADDHIVALGFGSIEECQAALSNNEGSTATRR